jgi:hypothetical protein
MSPFQCLRLYSGKSDTCSVPPNQTALLREVLSRERYHVLHFDLRIPGFADVSSLYMSLSQQMGQYFEEISSKMPGFEDFRKEACGFKVRVLALV